MTLRGVQPVILLISSMCASLGHFIVVCMVIMSHQTTLFGRILPAKKKYYVYENPSDKCQKFIEAYFHQYIVVVQQSVKRKVC